MLLNYNSVINNSNYLINYCCHTCDVFSVITIQAKPFSSRPAVSQSVYFDLLMQDYLVDQKIDVQEWEGTITWDKRRHLLSFYKINSDVKRILNKSFSDIFLYKGEEFPQDICFYRNKEVFISSTTHEEIINLHSHTSEDFEKLKRYLEDSKGW